MFVTCVFLEIRVTEARTIKEIRIARAGLFGSRLGVQSKSATSDCFSARPTSRMRNHQTLQIPQAYNLLVVSNTKIYVTCHVRLCRHILQSIGIHSSCLTNRE